MGSHSNPLIFTTEVKTTQPRLRPEASKALVDSRAVSPYDIVSYSEETDETDGDRWGQETDGVRLDRTHFKRQRCGIILWPPAIGD